MCPDCVECILLKWLSRFDESFCLTILRCAFQCEGVTSPLCCLQLPGVRNPSLTSGQLWLRLPARGLKSGPQRGSCVPAGDRRWGQGCSDVAFDGVCRSGLQEQFEQQPDGIGVRDWISTSVSLYVCSDYLAPLLIPLYRLVRHQVEGCRVRTGREQLTLQSQEFKQSLLWLLAAGQQGHLGADCLLSFSLLSSPLTSSTCYYYDLRFDWKTASTPW